MAHSEQEIRATYERYVATRDRVEAGELGWDALAAFFTDDATFIDPAWGRVEGIAAIREFLWKPRWMRHGINREQDKAIEAVAKDLAKMQTIRQTYLGKIGMVLDNWRKQDEAAKAAEDEKADKEKSEAEKGEEPDGENPLKKKD